MDPEKVRRFGEYKETGDEYVLPEPDPYEGLFVKVVKHEGKLKVWRACGSTAATWRSATWERSSSR